MATKVVHCKKERYDIYIGRPSIWGNPYIMDADHDRDDVLDCYNDYIRSETELLIKLHTLKDKTLGCFCSPLRCHGDILKELIEEYL